MAYPNAVGLVIPHLDGLHAVPVASRVPDPRPDEWIQVRQVGGAGLPPVRDVSRLDIIYWALTEPAARAGGVLVRAEIQALARTSTLGIPCYRVEETLQRQTDDPVVPGVFGWWATYALTLRANEVLPV